LRGGNSMNNNLRNQFNKLIRLDHTGSFTTKSTYRQAMGQFLNVCSDHFNAQNIKNLADKHLRYFVEEQMDDGVNQRTLQKEVAGIKHFLLIAGAKFSLTNHQLGIDGRKNQALPGVSETEYQRALNLCKSHGKFFEALAIKTMYHLGLRSNEVVNLRYGSLQAALKTNALVIEHGTKGGRKRSIALTEVQRATVQELEDSRLNPDGRTDSDKVFCSREKGAVQSQKARLHNFFTRYGHEIADAGREESISCHSFRRAAAQQVYDRARQTKSDKEAMAAVRDFLGHGPNRPEIDALYVKDRKTDNE
jgi:site-specific recombinase XerD